MNLKGWEKSQIMLLTWPGRNSSLILFPVQYLCGVNIVPCHLSPHISEQSRQLSIGQRVTVTSHHLHGNVQTVKFYFSLIQFHLIIILAHLLLQFHLIKQMFQARISMFQCAVEDKLVNCHINFRNKSLMKSFDAGLL